MSKFEQKNNDGALFKNDKPGENQPQAKGSAMIDGVEYWVSAWTNVDKNGNKYQKLSFTPKDKNYTPNQENQLRREGAAQDAKMPEEPDFDGSLPF